MLPKPVDLVQDHLAHVTHVLDDLEVEVEGRRAAGLVGGVVPDVEVGVLEGCLDGNSTRGVEGEHVIQQVQSVRVGVREQAGEGALGHEGEVAHVLLSSWRADAGERLLVGRSEDVEDLVELINVISTLEEGSAAEQLGQDAPY